VDAPAERSFLFGEYALDEGRMQLLRDGRALELETKPLLLLRYLLHHAGRIVARDELLRELWPGISVSDASLNTAD
jgi:non-specific serine/threonine protein kinase